MTFGSLFAGIGGFDLGLERAGMTCKWQVEIDPFCQKVLTKHWPDVPKFEDVRDVGAHNLERVDLICGGFPCQDISYAGFGAGLAGARSGLWWEYARIIREMGPDIVCVENVTALLERGLGDVLGTLASLGFDAEWSSLSACAVGATHARSRVFVVAYTNRQQRRSSFRDSIAQAFRPLQTVDCAKSARVDAITRLGDPSALYRGADGIPDGMERNRGLGNAVYPDVAEWIGRRIMEATQ